MPSNQPARTPKVGSDPGYSQHCAFSAWLVADERLKPFHDQYTQRSAMPGRIYPWYTTGRVPSKTRPFVEQNVGRNQKIMRGIGPNFRASLLFAISMFLTSSCLPISPLNPSNPKRYCLWNLAHEEIVVSTDTISDPRRILPGKFLICEVGTRTVFLSSIHGTRRTYALPEYVMGGFTIRRGRPCMDVGITDKWRIYELKDKTYDPKTEESTFDLGEQAAEANP